MARQRIVVGVDGSVAAQSALEWALRQARWIDATVLVVTAADSPAGAGAAPESLPERRRRLTALQQRCIADARAAVGTRDLPVIGRELLSADPLTALRQVGRRADMLVVGGGDRPMPASMAARLRRTGLPVVVVTPPQVAVPDAVPVPTAVPVTVGA